MLNFFTGSSIYAGKSIYYITQKGTNKEFIFDISVLSLILQHAIIAKKLFCFTDE